MYKYSGSTHHVLWCQDYVEAVAARVAGAAWADLYQYQNILYLSVIYTPNHVNIYMFIKTGVSLFVLKGLWQKTTTTGDTTSTDTNTMWHDLVVRLCSQQQ